VLLAERVPAYAGVMQARVSAEEQDRQENPDAADDEPADDGDEDDGDELAEDIDEFLAGIPMEAL
jgi:hypothetical protein